MQKKVSPIIKMCFGGSGVLTLYDLNYFSYQFSRRCLRQAPIVYRLIDSALIGNFFRDPLLFYLPISEFFFICIFFSGGSHAFFRMSTLNYNFGRSFFY